jgi:hypothetical protein
MELEVTIIDPKTQTKTPTEYEIHNGHLIIPMLGCAYILDPKLIKDTSKPFYYTDSVFPLNQPSKQIIRKYIEVKIKG